jgi:hypothetical protein
MSPANLHDDALTQPPHPGETYLMPPRRYSHLTDADWSRVCDQYRAAELWSRLATHLDVYEGDPNAHEVQSQVAALYALGRAPLGIA